MSNTLQKLFDAIEQKNAIILTSDEKDQIISHIHNLDKSQYSNYSSDTTFRILAKMFNNYIVNQRQNINESKINDELIGELKEGMQFQPTFTTETIHSIFGMSNVKDVLSVFNPDALQKKAYVLADSKYCIQSVQPPGIRTSFTWTLTNDVNIRTGTINVNTNLQNIKSIKLYRMRMPYLTQVVNSIGKRFTLLIKELSAQSYLNYDGTRFHFIMNSVVNSATDNNRYNVDIQYFNEGVFTFNQPITTIPSLTLIMTADLTTINFLHDRDTCTFTYGATTTITTTNAIGYVGASTYITITGFTTDAPATDKSTIEAINSVYPISATITGANTFTIAINTTAITPLVGLTANVYYEDRRIIFPFEFTYMGE